MEVRNSKSGDYSSTCRIRFISSKEYSLDWFGYYTSSEDIYIFSAVKTYSMVWKQNGLINIFIMFFCRPEDYAGTY